MSLLPWMGRLLQFIPAGLPGKTRVARLILKPYLRSRNVTITDKLGLRYLVPCLSEPVAFHLLANGRYEPEVLEFILRHLPSRGVFVDVGANIGCFTVPVAQLHPEASIMAIEASRGVFGCLQQNLLTNRIANVRAFNVAAHAHDGEVSFFEAPPNQFGMGALAPQFQGQACPVRARPLDTLLAEERLAQVHVIKIDVEGFELNVFQGAERLLTGPHPPALVFEFCDWAEARLPGGKPGDAQRYLRQLGFALWRLDDFNLSRAPLPAPLEQGYETLVALRPAA